MLYNVWVGEFIKVAKDLELKDDCQADTLYNDGINFEKNYGIIRGIEKWYLWALSLQTNNFSNYKQWNPEYKVNGTIKIVFS